MKQILQLQSKKIEAREETNYQESFTDSVNAEITKHKVRLTDNASGCNDTIDIHIDEFLQLCDYIKENYDKK